MSGTVFELGMLPKLCNWVSLRGSTPLSLVNGTISHDLSLSASFSPSTASPIR
jgi:hypothetical protein